jgi:hypothetical protein
MLVILLATAATAPGKAEQPVAGAKPQDASGKASRPDKVPETCPVTKPPLHRFVPQSPYPAKAGPGWFWFGKERLWTTLPISATWTQGEKTTWWRNGWDLDGRRWMKTGPKSELTVTARRLDGPAPPPGILPSGPVYREEDWRTFLLGGINFSTTGCWEVTGRYEKDELTFVVWVVARPTKMHEPAAAK